MYSVVLDDYINFLGVLNIDFNHDKKAEKPEATVKTVTFVDEVEEAFPPKDLKSNFQSMNEWLVNACENEHPGPTVETFKFGLFESPGEYILYYVGIETEVKQDRSITRIVFEPQNMYYLLQKKGIRKSKSGRGSGEN